jgi:WD40 repeat protein
MSRLQIAGLLVVFLVLFAGCSKELIYEQFGGGEAAARKVVFLPNGKDLAIGESLQRKETGHEVTVTVFNGTTYERKPLGKYKGSIDALAVSKDGKYIATGSDFDKTIRLWNVENGQMLTIGENIYPRGLAFTPDGKHLISSGNDFIRIWNVENREMRILDKCGDLLSLSSDGRILACDSYNESKSEVKLMGIQNTEKRSLPVPGRSIKTIVFSPDNKTIGLTSGDMNLESRTIRLLNTQSGDIRILGESEGDITAINFSSDGRQLASGDWRGSIRVWDVESRQMRIVGACSKNPVMYLSFSPDGKSLAAACNYDGFYLIKL